MNKIILFSLLTTILFSCSSNSTRRPIYESEVSLRGGNYKDQTWDDKLEFKRVSWFQDATLSHEVLLSKLDSNSKFSAWLGTDKLLLDSCQNLYIALVYADINAKQNSAYVIDQLTSGEYSEKAILDFSHQIKAHQNYLDWNLQRHKVVALCLKDSSKSSDIFVSLPGFKKIQVNK